MRNTVQQFLRKCANFCMKLCSMNEELDLLKVIRLTITSGAYWNSGCIAPAFVTSITLWRVWLKSGRCLIRRSSTGPSSSGVHVFGHAFENKEDTLNISCSLNLLAWLTAFHCTLLETSHFECCVLNVHKIGNVLYISIKIIISCWFALLFICLKFQTNLTSFCCIVAISFGVHFLSGHSVVRIKQSCDGIQWFNSLTT